MCTNTSNSVTKLEKACMHPAGVYKWARMGEGTSLLTPPSNSLMTYPSQHELSYATVTYPIATGGGVQEVACLKLSFPEALLLLAHKISLHLGY